MNQSQSSRRHPQSDRRDKTSASLDQERQTLAEDIALLVVRQYRRRKTSTRQSVDAGQSVTRPNEL